MCMSDQMMDLGTVSWGLVFVCFYFDFVLESSDESQFGNNIKKKKVWTHF